MTIIVLIIVQWVMWRWLHSIHEEWKFKYLLACRYIDRLNDVKAQYEISKSRCEISQCRTLMVLIELKTEDVQHALRNLAQ